MKIAILGDQTLPACIMASKLVERLGFVERCDNLEECDVAIAPLLTKILRAEDLTAPSIGTLIFHPSPLPYGRGKASMRWAYKRGEPVTAATWFWCNERIDGGDICEQEIIKIDYSLRPAEFYERDILPAMVRTLERALISIGAGLIRRVPQVDDYSSYD